MKLPQHLKEKMTAKANTANEYRLRFDTADAYEFLKYGYSLAIEWTLIINELPENRSLCIVYDEYEKECIAEYKQLFFQWT